MPTVLRLTDQTPRRQKQHVDNCKPLYQIRRQSLLHLRGSHFHNSLPLFIALVNVFVGELVCKPFSSSSSLFHSGSLS